MQLNFTSWLLSGVQNNWFGNFMNDWTAFNRISHPVELKFIFNIFNFQTLFFLTFVKNNDIKLQIRLRPQLPKTKTLLQAKRFFFDPNRHECSRLSEISQAWKFFQKKLSSKEGIKFFSLLSQKKSWHRSREKDSYETFIYTFYLIIIFFHSKIIWLTSLIAVVMSGEKSLIL